MMREIVLLLMTTFFIGSANAQMKLGNNPTTTNANALLELEATNKGLLLPRIALANTSSPTPMSVHIAGMTVYNTANNGIVSPGFYYNDGTSWMRLSTLVATSLWGLTGNLGTTAGTNFIGTTDNTDIWFKRNNIKSGLLSLANTSFGVNAASLSTGNYTVAIGGIAARDNITGSDIVAVGYAALATNVAGQYSVAIGKSSQSRANNTATTYPANNTSVGTFSLNGAADMPSNNTGIENTAMGSYALYDNSSGSKNTTIGFKAGFANTTGSNNIFIGAEQDGIAIGTSNQMNIGGLVFGAGMTGTGAAPAGKMGILTRNPSNTLEIGGTDAVRVPNGTTAERPTSIQFGQVRYNTTLGRGEMYVNDVNGDGTLGDSGWRIF
jgi:trimeric autotransporter adhesin